MEQYVTEIILAVVAVIVGLIKHPKLIDWVLEKLFSFFSNREPLKRIDLKEHSVYQQIRNYKSFLGTELLSNTVKEVFYQTFVTIILQCIEKRITTIIEQYDKKPNVDSYTMLEVDAMISEIELKIVQVFIIPPTISKSFKIWKDKLLISLRRSIEQIVYDTNSDSSYVQTYRLLDQVNAFINYLLNTGVITFNNMNGAFDNLKPNDVIRNYDDNTVKTDYIIIPDNTNNGLVNKVTNTDDINGLH